MRKRHQQLAQEHLGPARAVAPGSKVLPGLASSWAATQAAWRFYHNPHVSRPQLAQPLLEAARQGLEASDRWALVVHDWSCLNYSGHRHKTQRMALNGSAGRGYELASALVLDDRSGIPIAPVYLRLITAAGAYQSTQVQGPDRVESHLDALHGTFAFLARQSWSKPTVHLLDAEGDSVAHLRQWQAAGWVFLVRTDPNRQARWEDREQTLGAIAKTLKRRGAFHAVREVEFHGHRAYQQVAATTVTLVRPGHANRRAGRGRRKKRPRIRGPALELRLIVADVRDASGKLLARWLLLTNLPPRVSASRIALWYYWRWGIESYYKLLKSAGQELEHWLQKTPEALFQRLLVASMACVMVWQLARAPGPSARALRRVLGELSGRRSKPGTAPREPALLAGLWTLLALDAALHRHGRRKLLRLARSVLSETLGQLIPMDFV